MISNLLSAGLLSNCIFLIDYSGYVMLTSWIWLSYNVLIYYKGGILMGFGFGGGRGGSFIIIIIILLLFCFIGDDSSSC